MEPVTTYSVFAGHRQCDFRQAHSMGRAGFAASNNPAPATCGGAAGRPHCGVLVRDGSPRIGRAEALWAARRKMLCEQAAPEWDKSTTSNCPTAPRRARGRIPPVILSGAPWVHPPVILSGAREAGGAEGSPPSRRSLGYARDDATAPPSHAVGQKYHVQLSHGTAASPEAHPPVVLSGALGARLPLSS